MKFGYSMLKRVLVLFQKKSDNCEFTFYYSKHMSTYGFAITDLPTIA